MGVENLTYDTWEPILQGLGIRLVGSFGSRKVNENEEYSKGKRSHIPPGEKENHRLNIAFSKGICEFCRRVCFFDEIPNEKR